MATNKNEQKLTMDFELATNENEQKLTMVFWELATNKKRTKANWNFCMNMDENKINKMVNSINI
ncbi:MAG: hypothetical protein U9N76_05305 [Candidatus Marinimicrobia bacterium]|nr:hypothetical protein [Candidatus Neomarinimicrobiota bacterium]